MKSNLSIKQNRVKQKAIEATDMPKDVVLGIPVLTVLGDMEISIENYGGIIEYTDCIIRIRTKSGQIIITGKKLNVEYYTNDDMKIHGRIDSIEFRH